MKFAIRKILDTQLVLEDITDGEFTTSALTGELKGGFDDSFPCLFINPTPKIPHIKGLHYVFTLTPAASDAICSVTELQRAAGISNTDPKVLADEFTANSVSELRDKVMGFFMNGGAPNGLIRNRLYKEGQGSIDEYFNFIATPRLPIEQAESVDKVAAQFFLGCTSTADPTDAVKA